MSVWGFPCLKSGRRSCDRPRVDVGNSPAVVPLPPLHEIYFTGPCPGARLPRYRVAYQHTPIASPILVSWPQPGPWCWPQPEPIPIVFAGAGDPVAMGIVPALNRPGGNVTGFGGSEATLGGKWLELLSEIAPG